MFFSLIVSFFLGGLGFASPPHSLSLTFTSSVFDRLDLNEIQSLSPPTKWEEELVSYFESEALFVSGKIHESQRKRERLLESCELENGKELETRRSALCLMTMLGFYQSIDSQKGFVHASSLEKWLKSVSQGSLPFEDRAYVDMRTLWKLPSWLSPDRTRSLIACESLIRLHPENSSLYFFKSRILQAQGKKEKAEINLEEALKKNPRNLRALFWKAGIPEAKIWWGVLANPAGGLGLIVGRRDQRFLDSSRSLEVALSAQSRSVYQGFISYSDKEVFKKPEALAQVLVAQEREQYFGLGQKTELAQMREIRQMKSQGRVGVKIHSHKKYWLFSGEWIYRDPMETTSDPYLGARQLSLIPALEVAWGKAENGSMLIKIFGSHSSFLSSHSFWGYQAEAQKSWSLGGHWNLELRANLRSVSMESPLAVLSDLGGNMSLPGVRPGRFRDFFAGAFSPKVSFRFLERWQLGSFGNLSFLGKDLQASVNQRLLVGGGIFLGYGLKPFNVSIEGGYFSNELIIQSGSRWVF